MSYPKLGRVPALAICLVVAPSVAILSACSRDASRDAPAQAAPTKLSIGDFQLGAQLGPHGGIAQGANKSTFTNDEMIHVAMRLRDAPAGTTVKVVWKSPGGEALGEETKRLQPGQDYMHFSADGGSLPPGTGYQAEITANGAPVTVLRFDLRG